MPKVDLGSLINDNANRILQQLFCEWILDRSENVSAALLRCQCRKKAFQPGNLRQWGKQRSRLLADQYREFQLQVNSKTVACE